MAKMEIDLNGDAEGTDSRIKFVENSPATTIAPEAVVYADLEYFDGASLIVEFKDRSTTDDQLQIVGGQFGESSVYAIENDLYFRDEIIGSITGGTDGSTPLLISFHGKVTLEMVQAVIRSIGYANFSQDPVEGERYVAFTLLDREGIASRAAFGMIYVNPVDTPAVAEDDTVATNEDEVGTGSLFDPNGPGNDYDPDGPALRIAAVNGSAADVGRTITLRSGALLTVNEDGTYRYDPNGQFDYLTNKETGAANISAVDRFEYTLAGGGTATVTVIINGVASAEDQLMGDDKGNYIIGAEHADMVLLYQGGDDTVFGGGGGDVIYFGSAFTPKDQVNGGDGRDALVLQGNYVLTLSETSLTSIEALSLQSGANDRWGDTGNNFYSYDITTDDANVAARQQLIVNGQSLREGEDFTLDGSAERDGKFLVYGGHGVDTLRGGEGNDVFFFEGTRWSEADRVDGGAGRDAVIISSGSGVNRFEFRDDSFTGIESITVNARFASDPKQTPSYELVLAKGNVAEGATLIVNGSSLTNPEQTIGVDGSAVVGNLLLFGGAGADTLIGGRGGDLIYSGSGSDKIAGGAGADTFQYRATSDSGPDDPDSILDFEPGRDQIDLHFIDANWATEGDQAFSWIGSKAFSGAGPTSAGELRAYWRDGTTWLVEGDCDGDGSADLVITVILPGNGELGFADFVL